MRTHLAILILLLAGCQGLPAAAKLKGILYGSQGGTSATATGAIRLAVDGNIYNLAYQKPYRLILSSKECAYAGSIWTVEAILAADHQGTLISAECTGERDDFDLAAVLLVSRYLRLISDEAFSVAYSMFTTAYTKSHSLAEFMSEADKLNLSSYDQFGRQGQCLEIVRTPSEEAIDVRAGIECYLTYKVGGNAELVFEVEREQSSKEIKINSIQRE